MKPKKIPGVPKHTKGGYHDTESCKCFEHEERVLEEFDLLKQRFFNINHWKEYAGKGSAAFCMYNVEGKPADRAPVQGDYIRIDIPAPGNIEAKGYDWVQIKKISNAFPKKTEKENLLIECAPSIDPTGSDPINIAHFYNEAATSTFMISRSEKCIYAGIYGRNEQPNFKRASLPDKLRNSIIAVGGIIGFSKMEWKPLTEGLLSFQ
ncbi:hypothetical protein [Niabella aquatica]